MNRHTDRLRFDCAGGMLPRRPSQRWDAMPLIRAIAVVCTILTILSFI